MAAKISLGSRPKHFPATITVALPEGGEGSVTLQFIYRTRTEFGAFIDELLQAANVRASAQAAEGEALDATVRMAMEATRDANADYILRIANGWDLPDDFTRENVVRLCDELPGMAVAIMQRYRAVVTEGRLGN